MSLVPLSGRLNRTIKDFNGDDNIIYSLKSCEYLKLEPRNHLSFSTNKLGEQIIELKEQYVDELGDTNFLSLYKIKLSNLTLRQLLVLQSFSACKTQK